MVIFVSRSTRSGSSSDSTKIRGSSCKAEKTKLLAGINEERNRIRHVKREDEYLRPQGRARVKGDRTGREKQKQKKKEKGPYIEDLTGTETGAAVKPVIISEFIDLDPFAIVGDGHGQCHGPEGGRGGGHSIARDSSGRVYRARDEPQKGRRQARRRGETVAEGEKRDARNGEDGRMDRSRRKRWRWDGGDGGDGDWR